MNPNENHAKKEYAAVIDSLRMFPSDNYVVDVEKVDEYVTWLNVYTTDEAQPYTASDSRRPRRFTNGVRIALDEGQVRVYKFRNGATGQDIAFTNVYPRAIVNAVVREFATDAN